MSGRAHAIARWSSVLVIAFWAVWVTVVKPYDNGPAIRSDGSGYHISTYAILKGDISFSWYQGDLVEVALHETDPSRSRRGCKYPPGVAFLRLPVMALMTDPSAGGPPYSAAEHWACLVLGAAALITTAALGLDSCLRLGVAPVWANAAVLFLTFGTGLFHYGTYDGSFSHIYSALLVAGLIWLAVRTGEGGWPLPIVPVVALVAMLFLVRTTNVLLVGLWVLGCVGWSLSQGQPVTRFRLRAISATALGLAVGLGVTLALNFEMFDKLTLHTYPGEHFHWVDSRMHLVLFGKQYGLFRLYPVLGVTVLAGLVVPRTRILSMGLVLPIAAYTVIYGHWWTWHLSSGFGHRGFVEMVPFAMPVLALALDSLPRPTARGVTVLGGLLTIYTLIEMWQYWHNRPFLFAGQLFTT